MRLFMLVGRLTFKNDVDTAYAERGGRVRV